MRILVGVGKAQPAHSPTKIDVFDVAVISAAESADQRHHPSNSGGALARHLQRQPATDREPQKVTPVRSSRSRRSARHRRYRRYCSDGSATACTRHARDHDFKLLCRSSSSGKSNSKPSSLCSNSSERPLPRRSSSTLVPAIFRFRKLFWWGLHGYALRFAHNKVAAHRRRQPARLRNLISQFTLRTNDMLKILGRDTSPM